MVGGNNLAILPTIPEGKELDPSDLVPIQGYGEDNRRIKEMDKRRLLREVKSVLKGRDRLSMIGLGLGNSIVSYMLGELPLKHKWTQGPMPAW